MGGCERIKRDCGSEEKIKIYNIFNAKTASLLFPATLDRHISLFNNLTKTFTNR